MKQSINNLLSIAPLIFIICQFIFITYYDFATNLTPLTLKEISIKEIENTIKSGGLEYSKFESNDYQNEIYFYLKNKSGKPYQVVLSSNKNIISQVTALQKLIRIANIKGKDIQFIDLSLRRPYATL